ncbi:DNA-binding MarR family transcriptional regulator [Nocardia transvalensis]|uniref:DNA-binding MarR family transcriptional regulator n=1 Tax=Nocardia transvalensis TaxID=37333 RepID=A0A7W9UIX8_9NOCA|nr:MarR family transcriptional regulator [Nocardia transvalensis]MBB5914175.1 DNA-binding MarR family transcriptional regulator [Nocardia transvalensis]
MTRTDQDLFATAAVTTFKLNGQFLAVAEELARPAGITVAWWQVLGAILRAPLPVAGIAREMGITRQSVQRVADLLVDKGFAEYRTNPAHRRAKLVAITEVGHEAVRRIDPQHAEMAKRLAAELGTQRLAEIADALTSLSAALERIGH